MLTSLSLTDFRGFSRLQIPRLARVNLIGGVNNVGKTTLLEAIYLLLTWDSNGIKELPGMFRSPSQIDDKLYFWEWLVGKHRNNRRALLTAHSGEVTFSLGLDQSPSARSGYQQQSSLEGINFHYVCDSEGVAVPGADVCSLGPTSPIEDANVYIKAARRKDNETRIETLLREVDPRLQRVRNYPDERTSKPLLYAHIDVNDAIPASQLGQGFNRLLRIYSALLSAEADVFLIDEVETGLYHGVLPTVWKGLAAVARQEDVQIFATTHSREAILAAHRVFSEEPEYDFAYHRLERDLKGEVQVVTYDQEALAGADEANFEVR